MRKLIKLLPFVCLTANIDAMRILSTQEEIEKVANERNLNGYDKSDFINSQKKAKVALEEYKNGLNKAQDAIQELNKAIEQKNWNNVKNIFNYHNEYQDFLIPHLANAFSETLNNEFCEHTSVIKIVNDINNKSLYINVLVKLTNLDDSYSIFENYLKNIKENFKGVHVSTSDKAFEAVIPFSSGEDLSFSLIRFASKASCYEQKEYNKQNSNNKLKHGFIDSYFKMRFSPEIAKKLDNNNLKLNFSSEDAKGVIFSSMKNESTVIFYKPTFDSDSKSMSFYSCLQHKYESANSKKENLMLELREKGSYGTTKNSEEMKECVDLSHLNCIPALSKIIVGSNDLAAFVKLMAAHEKSLSK